MARLLARLDIGIEPEHVSGIVFVFECNQLIVVRSVGRSYLFWLVIPRDVVDVCTA